MPWPILISSPDDPRVEPYLNIRDRDLVRQRRSFIAEGSVVVRKLVQSRTHAPQSALILRNRLDGLGDVVDAMQARGLPVYVAERDVIDAVAGFPMHRGVLAVGTAPQALPVDDLVTRLPETALVVVCVGISNHDNIGAIFRNAAAFGAASVLLDSSCCDPLYRKAIRVSVGSVFDVPYARIDGITALQGALARAGFRSFALSPAGRQELRQVQRPDRAALYVGTEGEGLPGDLLEALETVRIDMQPGFDSLNVAAATAIALYNLTPTEAGARLDYALSPASA